MAEPHSTKSSLSLPAGTPDSGSSSSFVQLHPKNKPSKKRPLEDMEDWDNIETYMFVKQRKLRDQFKDMGVAKKSNIFEGVTIYVNGWTQPKAEELKEMMYAHGGRYEYNIYSRSVVTHTIASNLPNSKILKLGSSIVCKPSWVVDSIAANKLLPVDNYLLYKPKSGQNTLKLPRKVKVEVEDKDVNVLNEFKVDNDTSDKDISNKVDIGDDMNGVNRAEGSTVKSASNADLRSSKKVNEFFTHSRLHYLSTWSTELKQFTAEMLKKVTPRLQKLPSSASLKGLRTRAVVHIDLDCFFVSVSIRDKPHLWGKPVAVTHAKLSQQSSDQTNSASLIHGAVSHGDLETSTHQPPLAPLDSTSDIASCSYEARDAGVSNGMLVGAALKKCPGLILLPYDFKSYREVSQTFYETLLQYSSVVEAVSCDEAYIELTDYCRDPSHVLETIQKLRDEVQSKTGCTVSAGISHNMLLARMCTRVAKPDGQFYLSAKDTPNFLASQSVRDLPGVGYSTAIKLRDMRIENCAELKSESLDRLQSQFGNKTGKMLHDYARGVDNRELKTTGTERKSVSVDINFGIRFQDLSEAESLVKSLAEELQKRAEQAQVVGNQLTLKMKIRKKDAPIEPRKFLGHGACDNISKSVVLLQPSRDASESSTMAVRLLKQLSPIASDIRGMGLQLGKLVSREGGRDGGGSDGRVGTRAGADLRKILKSAAKVETSRTLPATEKITLPKQTGTVQKSTTAKYFKSPRKSPAKSPAKSRAKPSSSKSLKQFFGSVASSVSPVKESVEDSFSIELPPASQLSHSVLEALPAHLCDKILQGYTRRGDKVSIHRTMATRKEDPAAPSHSVDGVVRQENDVVANQEEDEEIVVHDDRIFLASWKQYIRGWFSSFEEEGPVGDDVTKIADYLCRLAKTNLEMTELCLKSLKRLVELQGGSQQAAMLPWISAFNLILKQVQERVKQIYGGALRLEPL